MADTELDTEGLTCPEPVMMLHQAIRKAVSGDVIRVVATDPSTERDIPKFCHYLNHELISKEEHQGRYIYRIKKS